MDLWVIFLTGLTVGGLTCMAVQGGLLAGTLASREEEDIREGVQRKHNLLPVLSFLSTKLIAHIILGFILGLFGTAAGISDNAKVVIQLFAGVYMIAIGLDLLNVHPVFRYVIIQPPRFLTKMMRNQAKSKDIFAPALLGIMTIFIPCGTTLAMEAYAISSGNPLLGALVMGVFILGTSPLFLGLGYLTTALGDAFRTRFLKIAAALVLYLGITSFNGALTVAGSPVTLQTIGQVIPFELNLNGQDPENFGQNIQIIDGVQVADITVFPSGYNPDYIQVQAGKPVRLNLTTSGKLGCTSAFRIPQLKIAKNLSLSKTESIEFTPTQVGKITWTCSMGMYIGLIEVI